MFLIVWHVCAAGFFPKTPLRALVSPFSFDCVQYAPSLDRFFHMHFE